MGEERRSEGSGAAVAVVVIVVVLGLIGLLAVGGVGAIFFFRWSQVAQMQEMRARVEVEQAHLEMLDAKMRSEASATEAAAALAAAVERQAEPDLAVAASPDPELLLEIDAAGQYTLAGKTLSFEELKDALLAEHLEKGPNLVLVISAQAETPFKRVNQAMEAAECASITKSRIRNKAVPAETPASAP